jgi:hypothetical protein
MTVRNPPVRRRRRRATTNLIKTGIQAAQAVFPLDAERAELATVSAIAWLNDISARDGLGMSGRRGQPDHTGRKQAPAIETTTINSTKGFK